MAVVAVLVRTWGGGGEKPLDSPWGEPVWYRQINGPDTDFAPMRNLGEWVYLVWPRIGAA